MKVVLFNPVLAIFATAYVEQEPLQGEEGRLEDRDKRGWRGGQRRERFQKCLSL